MDFLGLDFPPGSFDAVYAVNCLLHVPDADLPAVLEAVRGLLRSGGLLYVGAYEGDGTEGVLDGDDYVPPRFFSFRTAGQLLGFAAGAGFEVADFHPAETGRGHRFLSLTLRRPWPPGLPASAGLGPQPHQRVTCRVYLAIRGPGSRCSL